MSSPDNAEIRERNIQALTILLSSYVRAEWAEKLAEVAISAGFRHPGITEEGD